MFHENTATNSMFRPNTATNSMFLPQDVVTEITQYLNIRDIKSFCISCKNYHQFHNIVTRVPLIRSQLMLHQIDAANWCLSKENKNENMILNLDIGSGKTSVMCYLASKSKKPSILLCTPSLYSNWITDSKKLFGDRVKFVEMNIITNYIASMNILRENAMILKLPVPVEISIEDILSLNTIIYIDTISFTRYFYILQKKLGNIGNHFERIIFDECHNIDINSEYYNILKYHVNIPIIGLTANNISSKNKICDIFKKNNKLNIFKSAKLDYKTNNTPNFINLSTPLIDVIISGFYNRLIEENTDKYVGPDGYLIRSKIKNLFIRDLRYYNSIPPANLRLVDILETRTIIYKKDKNVALPALYGLPTINKRNNNIIISDFNEGRINTMISYFKYSDGINYSNVDSLIILGIPETYPKFKQIVGRVHRYGMNKTNIYYLCSTDKDMLDNQIMEKYISKYLKEYS